MANVKLSIDGMHCGSCVSRVERALASVPGVRDARVNLTTGSAVVEGEAAPPRLDDLVSAVRHAGYDARPFRPAAESSAWERSQSQRLRQHRQAVVVALGLGLPIMALDFAGPALSSTHAGGHLWWQAIQALLTLMLLRSPAGGPILAGGLVAIGRRTPNMDSLISLAVATAFLAGVASFFVPGLQAFHFHAIAMILLFINIGRYLEARARRQASGGVAALAQRMPTTALRVTEAGVAPTPVAQLQKGDRVRIPHDTVVPVDGEVIEGEAAVDEAAITGESVPRRVCVGDEVKAGTTVREGLITVAATRVGQASALGRIIRAVEDAQMGKTRWERIADRVAGVFVPIVAVLALWLVMRCAAS